MAYYPMYNTYSNIYPAQTGQMVQTGQMSVVPPQPQQGINWVQGLAGAKAFMVAPGQTAFLMDSEGQTFYMKSADQSGMPTLRVFDFQERLQQAPVASQSNGAYEDLVKRVTALEATLMPRKEASANESTV